MTGEAGGVGRGGDHRVDWSSPGYRDLSALVTSRTSECRSPRLRQRHRWRHGGHTGAVLEQERLIARVREACASDPNLMAALTYGSFAQGQADEWSDIEFWLFFDDPTVVDPVAWCDGIAPTLLVVENEFGAHVAIFGTLVRGEFHIASVAAIETVAGWPARGAAVDDMIVLDRTGELRLILERLREGQPAPSRTDVERLCATHSRLQTADEQLPIDGTQNRTDHSQVAFG